MGSVTSTVLQQEEIEELEKTTVFSASEIESIYERFKMLDRGNLGQITYQNLIMVPEFVSNPFGYRFIQVLEQYINYEDLSFPVFLDFLQLFNIKYSRTKRMRFIFQIFDLNGDGKLCKNVFYRLFKKIMGNDCIDKVNEIFIYHDPECKGYLDYKDFCKFYLENDLDKIFTYDFDTGIVRKSDPNLFAIF